MTRFHPAARVRRDTAILAGTLAVLIATTGISGAAVTATASDRYVTEAQAYVKKGNAPAAIIQLKNALRENPENGQARFDLGNLYIQTGDFPSALREFESLRNRGFDESKIVLPVGRCHFALGRYSEVVKIDPAEAVPGDRAGVLALKGRAHLALRDKANARTAIAAALKEDPKAPDALFVSALLLRSEGKLAEAEAEIDKALATGPTRTEVMIFKGDLRREQKDDAGAIKVYDAVVAKSPNDRAARLGRAVTHITFKRPEAAKADINAVLAADPKNPQAVYLSAYTLNLDGRYADAINVLNASPDLLSNYPPSLYLHAASAMSAGQAEVALKSAAAYNAQVPGDANGVKLLASVHQRLGMAEEAASLLEPLTAEYPKDNQLKLQLASAYLAGGRSQDAVKLFQESLANDPSNTQARLSMALGELRSGATDAGIAHLETVLEAKPTSLEANAALILAAIQAGDLKKAVATADALVKADPDNPNAYNLQGTAQIAAHNNTAARAAFMAALGKDARFTPAMLNLAELETMSGNRPAAKQWFEKALAADPKNAKAYEKLADLSLREGQPEQAIGYLERGIHQDPKAMGIRLQLIDVLLRTEEKNRALVAARAAVDALPTNPQALDALARTQRATGDYVNAVGTYQQLAARYPDNLEAQHRLARTMMQAAEHGGGDPAGRWNQARDVLDEALGKAPDNLMLLTDRIDLESKTAGAGAALTLAQKMAEERPQSVERLIALGAMQSTSGDVTAALDTHRAAWKKKESGLTALRLYESLIRARKNDEALTFMKAWADRNPADRNARFVLASQYIAMGKVDDALRETEALHKALPNNPIILNNLAWLYGEKDPAKAIEYAEQAHAISPQSADIMDTLGWLYVTKGDTAKGEALLAKAHAAAPTQPGIAYRYAAALEKSGRSAQARTVLQKLLANAAPFSERQEAQALLTRIGS